MTPIKNSILVTGAATGKGGSVGKSVVELLRKKEFKPHALPEHLQNHILTMVKLHADNRYNRMTNDVTKITGKPAIGIKDFVIAHPELFKIAVPN